jgi:hypothetical protein
MAVLQCPKKDSLKRIVPVPEKRSEGEDLT